MIDYVIAHNPDDRVINRAIQILSTNGLVCFPTDTSWIVAANPFSKIAVEKLHRLKKEDHTKHFSLLCSSIKMASELALIDNIAFKMLNKLTPGHYTFIFWAKKIVTKSIKASKTDHEIGLRFIPSPLVEKIIEAYGQALMSTNITPALLGLSEDDDIYAYQIEECLSNQIELIIDPGEFEFVGESTIISFTGEEGPVLVREGAGEF